MRSKYEKKSEATVKLQGFLTDYKIRPPFALRGYNVDYFGLFDHLFYNPETKELKMVQVKGVSGISSELRNRIINFEVNKVTREIWTYREDGTLKKEIYR